MEISLEERHALTEALYDELINSVLKIVDRLDLTSNRAAEDDMEVGGVTAFSRCLDLSLCDCVTKYYVVPFLCDPSDARLPPLRDHLSLSIAN